MSRRGSTSRVGLGRTVTVRIPDALASAMEAEREAVGESLGVELSASDILRRAIKNYLVEAGHPLTITPWPEPPNLEEKVRRLEAEIERLQKLVPHAVAKNANEVHFFQ